YALLKDKVPRFNKKLKPQPNTYYLNLASACFKHNKNRWSLDLIEVYIKEEPKSYQALKLKIKILKKLNQLNEAEAFAREAKKRLPKNLDLSLYLTDILIKTNR